VVGGAAEGVLESGQVVHIQRHHPIGTHGFQQRRHVASGYWIARLTLTVFTGIGQIRDDRRNPCRRGVFQAAQKKQQPA